MTLQRQPSESEVVPQKIVPVEAPPLVPKELRESITDQTAEQLSDLMVDIEQQKAEKIWENFGHILGSFGRSLKAMQDFFEKSFGIKDAFFTTEDIDPPPAEAAAQRQEEKNVTLQLAPRERWKQWDQYFQNTSNRYQVPKSSLLAIVQMESGFDTQARPLDRRTGQYLSSALGLSQALDSTWRAYSSDPEIQRRFKNPDRRNPEHAIDFVGWYMRKLESEVNKKIDQDKAQSGHEGFLEEYRLNPKGDLKWVYMAYHEGSDGYLRMRRYLDPKNADRKSQYFMQLKWWQKKQYAVESVDRYSGRVAKVGEEYQRVVG